MNSIVLHTKREEHTTLALASRLKPIKAGDPLGLGVARPPPPADPDVFDKNLDEAEFCRGLLPAEDRNMFLTPDEVRKIIIDNSVKNSVISSIDPELMITIDGRMDFKLFIAGGEIYTREQLYDMFPFHEFNTQPEAVFASQIIGIFQKNGPPEFLSRDSDDESTFYNIAGDQLPVKVVKTKIYFGRERWEDFVLMHKMARGVTRVKQLGFLENTKPAAKNYNSLELLSDVVESPATENKVCDSQTIAEIKSEIIQIKADLAELKKMVLKFSINC